MSRILSTGGVLSQHALQVVSQHALQGFQVHTQGGSLGGSGQGGVSRPTPKGEVEGDLVQAHSQGEVDRGSGPGPHQRGKLRGIWPGGVPAPTVGDSLKSSGGATAPGGCLLMGGVETPRDGYCCGQYVILLECMTCLSDSFSKKTIK